MPPAQGAGEARFNTPDLADVVRDFTHLGPFQHLSGKVAGKDHQRVQRLIARAIGAWLPEDPDELPTGLALRPQELALVLRLAANTADAIEEPLQALSSLPLEGYNGESWAPGPDTAREWRKAACMKIASYLADHPASGAARRRPSEPHSGLRMPYVDLPLGVDIHAQPSVLLQAKFGIVPFLGRASALGKLVEWACDNDAPFGLRTITGPGGAGKSRLAAELCEYLAHEGWDAGFFDPGDAGQLVPSRPTVVIIDYVVGEVGRIAELSNRFLYETTRHRSALAAGAQSRIVVDDPVGARTTRGELYGARPAAR